MKDNPVTDEIHQSKPKTLKDLVNTPFKKAMFVVQIISYILIVGSPVIGAIIGSQYLDLNTGQTSGVDFRCFYSRGSAFLWISFLPWERVDFDY
jgi:hypothetical protein